MSAFDTVQKTVKPTTKYTLIPYSLLTSATATVDGIVIHNMFNGLLGSTNGSTYGTFGYAFIPMAAAGYSSVWIAPYWSTPFNQNLTLQVLALTADGLAVYNTVATLLTITVPQTTDLRFIISDTTVGEGGVTGGASATAQAVYRLILGASMPYIGVTFNAGSAPSAGALANFHVCRSA